MPNDHTESAGEPGAQDQAERERSPAAWKTITYLAAGLPEPVALEPGQAIVHNHVRPARFLGQRGFRAWIAGPDDGKPGIGPGGYQIVRCECGWAPALGEHYRVDRDLDRLRREAR